MTRPARSHWLALSLLVLGLLAGPLPAGAQRPEPVAAGETAGPRTYGTSEFVSHTVPAYAFTWNKENNDHVTSNVRGARYCEGTTECTFYAPVLLPAGALVSFFSVEACDSSPTGRVTASFIFIDPDNNGFATSDAGTTFDEAPGCVTRTVTTNRVINNNDFIYHVEVKLTGTATLDGFTRLKAARLYYRLQVSPAPATATFGDVPTNHPFFPFIEALVAAGITAGCSATPPLYCPDQPVTRGQMATFLARALGLHFSP